MDEVSGLLIMRRHALHAGTFKKRMNHSHFGDGFGKSRGTGCQDVNHQVHRQSDAAELRMDDDSADGAQMTVDPA